MTSCKVNNTIAIADILQEQGPATPSCSFGAIDGITTLIVQPSAKNTEYHHVPKTLYWGREKTFCLHIQANCNSECCILNIINSGCLA